MALKDNHPHLGEDVRLGLAPEAARGRRLPAATVEQEQGRLESRCYGASDASDWLPQQPEGVGLPAVGRGAASRLGGATTTTA